MSEELDGRDELVKKTYKSRKDLVAAVNKPEKVLEGYSTNPWEKAFYSRFDDLKPIREAYWKTYVDGIPGARIWHLPVTEVAQHSTTAAWFDQLEVGTVIIREIPNADGTSEFVMSIKAEDK